MCRHCPESAPVDLIYSSHKNSFSGGSVVKNLLASAGDTGSIPGLGRSLGEGNGNPLQYSHLGKPMDRGAWWATVHGVTKSDTTEWLIPTGLVAICERNKPCSPVG